MKDHIKVLIESVEVLEKDFTSKGVENKVDSIEAKEQALELLAKLKRAQDDPANEEYDDDYEDLIFRVIYIVGQF